MRGPRYADVVEGLDDLKHRVAGGWYTYAILLAGGAAYSAKTIKRGKVWKIVNHIDDTSQLLTDEELWTESNIGEALDKRALVTLEGYE